MKLQILLSFVLLSSASANPAPYVLHERRHAQDSLPRGQRVAGDSIVSFRIGLKQSNLEHAYDYLTNVSDPLSPHYGKLWTHEDIHKTFAPSQETTTTVKTWLTASGIERVTESANNGWLSFESTTKHVEDLFLSRYYEYSDTSSDTIRIGCDEYSVPEHIAEHIDYITPGVVLSNPLEKRTVVTRDEPNHHGHHPTWHMPHRRPKPNPSWRHKPWHPSSSSGSLPANLQNCGFNMTTTCIRALYDIPSPSEVASSYCSNTSNSVGVFEFESTYRQSDLDLFFQKFAPQVPQGTHPKLDSVEGAKLTHRFEVQGDDAEANIDLDIVYALTYPHEVTLYQVNPRYNSVLTNTNPVIFTIENLLEAIDGSFCTAEDVDKGKDCGIYAATNVISISYGSTEVFFPPSQQKRTCLEMLKQGLRGVTFTISSGDYGVTANPGLNPKTGQLTNGCIVPGDYNATTGFGIGGPTPKNGTVFNLLYPQNCPYALSVGGTQLNTDDTVLDAESAMNVPGLLADITNGTYNPPVTFSSAGGFSNYFSRPAYQSSTVGAYFANHDPGYPYYVATGDAFPANIGANGGLYNREGRGFPDVSANGVNLLYYEGGSLGPEWGTSLAAPTWASIITLINDKRSQHGKGPVGFINPVLYKHPEVFHDITNGSNPGCGTNGFTAVQGWDPVTGLGTPNFPKLLELFLSLP